MFRKVYDFIRLLISELTAKRVFDSAAALTYSTILAIVPIMAVVFAVARGFGYSKYIETWFRDMLTSQPQAAEIIIGFVNSYLVHTKSGIILGLGLVFMLWTVLMLVSNIEKTFNDIWQVKKPRSLFRTFTDYIAMLFLVPIITVVMAGISIFMATIADNLDQYVVILVTLYIIVGRFLRIICFHAQHKGAFTERHLAGYLSRYGNAMVAVLLHSFSDMGKQL